jgi:polar amino acid transport system substrate-binding protein
MRLLQGSLLALLTLLASWAVCAENPPMSPFRVVTAELRPFAVDNQPAAPGLTVELTEAICVKVGAPAKIEFYPWARAYALALADPRVAVIPLTRTPPREARFQWLVRLYRQQYVFITKIDKPPITSIDEARKVKRIGVLRGSPTADFAESDHFPLSSILKNNSVEAGLKDLDAGIVDTYYGGEAITKETIRSTHRKLADYHIGVAMGGGDIWLAASGGFSDSDVAALRKAFDELVNDGTYARLLKKYDLPK